MADDTAIELALRPRVPMPYVQALGGLAALAVCECVDGAQILWPATVLLDGAVLARVSLEAGYDGSMFAQVGVVFSDARDDLSAIGDAILARADAWEQAVAAGRSAAGPFASFAGDYFDRMAGLDEQVELLFPNGRVYCTAELEGIDVWGRICVETADGRDTEYAPEQVALRLLG
ncbi:hypothetical protein EII22_08040 [Coriobacteriales bacterium OH1046]|nr:hypothetical protein EII22_08040 [Coriobacteriales bacterium OH1046]